MKTDGWLPVTTASTALHHTLPASAAAVDLGVTSVEYRMSDTIRRKCGDSVEECQHQRHDDGSNIIVSADSGASAGASGNNSRGSSPCRLRVAIEVGDGRKEGAEVGGLPVPPEVMSLVLLCADGATLAQACCVSKVRSTLYELCMKHHTRTCSLQYYCCTQYVGCLNFERLNYHTAVHIIRYEYYSCTAVVLRYSYVLRLLFVVL